MAQFNYIPLFKVIRYPYTDQKLTAVATPLEAAVQSVPKKRIKFPEGGYTTDVFSLLRGVANGDRDSALQVYRDLRDLEFYPGLGGVNCSVKGFLLAVRDEFLAQGARANLQALDRILDTGKCDIHRSIDFLVKLDEFDPSLVTGDGTIGDNTDLLWEHGLLTNYWSAYFPAVEFGHRMFRLDMKVSDALEISQRQHSIVLKTCRNKLTLSRDDSAAVEAAAVYYSLLSGVGDPHDPEARKAYTDLDNGDGKPEVYVIVSHLRDQLSVYRTTDSDYDWEAVETNHLAELANIIHKL